MTPILTQEYLTVVKLFLKQDHRKLEIESD